MKLLLFVVLTFSSQAFAVDYNLCNDAINNTFKKNKNFPYGFIQLNSNGEIEAAPCSLNQKDKNCSIKSFDRVKLPESYVVSQNPVNGLVMKPEDRQFKIVREGLEVKKIISGQDELQLTVSNGKCVAKALISEVKEENVREMSFDLVACKTFHEVEKKYGQKLSDCYAQDLEILKKSSTKNVLKVGTSCQVELKDIYKNMVSLKSDILSRYGSDPTLIRKPFASITPPAVFNDQVIENFICAYEASFVGSSGKKDCSNNGTFAVEASTDTSLGVILSNKKTCALVYSDMTLNDAAIFTKKSPDSLVYVLNEEGTEAGKVQSGGGSSKGKNQ